MIEMYFDGCCEPINPGGHSSYGVILFRGKETLFSQSGYCGFGPKSSNNVAEYSGFIRGLEFLIETPRPKGEHVQVYGDSALVINQMFGTWKIKQGIYVPYALRAKKLLKKIKGISGQWIPREENHYCDVLSKQILIDKGIHFRLQPLVINEAAPVSKKAWDKLSGHK